MTSSSPHALWPEPSPCMIYPELSGRPGRITTPSGDLRYINLHGDFSSMASQLGEGLSEPMRRGALKKLARGLEHGLQATPFATLSPLISSSSQRLITRRLQQQLPPTVMRALTQLADTSSIPLRTVLDAHLMPETLLWLRQTMARPPLQRTLPPFIHSSSVLSPSSTRPLLGTNFHYLGANTWERYTTLTGYHSSRAHSCVAVTTAGLLGAGHCAMNSAGIVLVVHPLHIQGVHLKGRPLGLCTDAIMRHASSLEEALEIVRAHQFMIPIGLALLEGDTGRSLIIERSPQREHVHWFSPDDPALHYHHNPLSHRLRLQHIPDSLATQIATTSRHRRHKELIKTLPSHATPEHLMRHLADMHASPESSLPGMTSAQIAHPDVLSSVVFDPAHRRVWVAAGKSPTSRGWFIPFELQPGRHRPTTQVDPICVDSQWTHTPHGKALESYRQACYRANEGEPAKKLLLLLEHALALWPHDVNLHVACGLLAMRAKSLNRAQGSFERALAMEPHHARRCEIELYLAMTLDLGAHTRGQAKTLYAQIATRPASTSRIAQFARRKRRRRLKHDELLKLPLDLSACGLHF